MKQLSAGTHSISVIVRATHCRISYARLSHYIGIILQALGLHAQELSIMFVSDQQMRYYNRKTFGRDYATDVISFPLQARDCQSTRCYLGDSIVNVDRARYCAHGYGQSVDREFMRYVIHSILHLIGHDDRTKALRAKMTIMEDVLLARIAPVGRMISFRK